MNEQNSDDVFYNEVFIALRQALKCDFKVARKEGGPWHVFTIGNSMVEVGTRKENIEVTIRSKEGIDTKEFLSAIKETDLRYWINSQWMEDEAIALLLQFEVPLSSKDELIPLLTIACRKCLEKVSS